MPSKKELYEKAKQVGIKKISKMNKNELEDALLVYYSACWFNDIAGNKITIHEDEDIMEVEVLDIMED